MASGVDSGDKEAAAAAPNDDKPTAEKPAASEGATTTPAPEATPAEPPGEAPPASAAGEAQSADAPPSQAQPESPHPSDADSPKVEAPALFAAEDRRLRPTPRPSRLTLPPFATRRLGRFARWSGRFLEYVAVDPWRRSRASTLLALALNTIMLTGLALFGRLHIWIPAAPAASMTVVMIDLPPPAPLELREPELAPLPAPEPRLKPEPAPTPAPEAQIAAPAPMVEPAPAETPVAPSPEPEPEAQPEPEPQAPPEPEPEAEPRLDLTPAPVFAPPSPDDEGPLIPEPEPLPAEEAPIAAVEAPPAPPAPPPLVEEAPEISETPLDEPVEEAAPAPEPPQEPAPAEEAPQLAEAAPEPPPQEPPPQLAVEEAAPEIAAPPVELPLAEETLASEEEKRKEEEAAAAAEAAAAEAAKVAEAATAEPAPSATSGDDMFDEAPARFRPSLPPAALPRAGTAARPGGAGVVAIFCDKQFKDKEKAAECAGRTEIRSGWRPGASGENWQEAVRLLKQDRAKGRPGTTAAAIYGPEAARRMEDAGKVGELTDFRKSQNAINDPAGAAASNLDLSRPDIGPPAFEPNWTLRTDPTLTEEDLRKLKEELEAAEKKKKAK